MGRRPFEGMGDTDVGLPQFPYLQCGNVRHDLNKPKESNIESSEARTYDLRVDLCEYKDARSGIGYFLATFFVIRCLDATPNDGSSAPNSVAVWQCMASSESFKRDVKTFCCTAMNCDPSLLNEAATEAVISRQQPITANRRYIRVLVGPNKKTQKKNKDFTPHVWKPLDAVFDPTGALVDLKPASFDAVAEYVKAKGEVK